MSVLTLVQRILPISFWKRKTSSTKGKERDADRDDLAHPSDQDSNPAFGSNAEAPSTTLHCDVSDAVHVAVNPSPEKTNGPRQGHVDTDSESDSDSISEAQIRQTTDPVNSSAPALFRGVSWASIVRTETRWSNQQEKQLLMAEKQLARCQKAWSSEQELWLSYIDTLSEEKKAHDGFMLMRTRQQEDERNQFRKAWKRRRSVETVQSQVQPVKEYSHGAPKRRVPRSGYSGLGPTLVASLAAPMACRG
ncbi:hypothetical protein N7492_008707 [Penicillium capsulatum]|uniref:Uncharacterized protein n=1 Tax=Penicillium capsulatum TaxID=69766 RepID=A0A9W9HT73_9EURO|nr:hypothetical protein N7492_008707 [Penicillium capsulatum]